MLTYIGWDSRKYPKVYFKVMRRIILNAVTRD